MAPLSFFRSRIPKKPRKAETALMQVCASGINRNWSEGDIFEGFPSRHNTLTVRLQHIHTYPII